MKSEFRQRHAAALVAKGGKIIKLDYNRPEYSSFSARFIRGNQRKHASRHAEERCIHGIEKVVTQGATIYVVRCDREGNFLFSKPCKICYSIMKHAGIKKVFYTVNSDEIMEIKL